jgi:hypothetical protein
MSGFRFFVQDEYVLARGYRCFDIGLSCVTAIVIPALCIRIVSGRIYSRKNTVYTGACHIVKTESKTCAECESHFLSGDTCGAINKMKLLSERNRGEGNYPMVGTVSQVEDARTTDPNRPRLIFVSDSYPAVNDESTRELFSSKH